MCPGKTHEVFGLTCSFVRDMQVGFRLSELESVAAILAHLASHCRSVSGSAGGLYTCQHISDGREMGDEYQAESSLQASFRVNELCRRHPA